MEQNDDVDNQKRANTNKLKNSHEAQHIPRSKQKRSITHIGLVVFSTTLFQSDLPRHAMPFHSMVGGAINTNPFLQRQGEMTYTMQKTVTRCALFHTLLLLVLSCSQAHRVVSFSHPTLLMLSHSFTLSPSLPGTLFFSAVESNHDDDDCSTFGASSSLAAGLAFSRDCETERFGFLLLVCSLCVTRAICCCCSGAPRREVPLPGLGSSHCELIRTRARTGSATLEFGIRK